MRGCVENEGWWKRIQDTGYRMEGVEGWSVCVEGCVVEGCVVENAGRRIHFSFFIFFFSSFF